MLKKGYHEIDVVVPSGNFGNILAGYIAKKMGIKIRRLVVSTNENQVLDRFFKTGRYQQENVKVTSSPSMDISKASNIERYFFDVLSRNPDTLRMQMEEFETHKEIDFSDHLDHIHTHDGFWSGSATHQDRLAMMRKVFEDANRVIDPHTAAGVHTALMVQNDECPLVCMETAKPTKFEETVFEALGMIPERSTRYKDIENRKQRFYDCANRDEVQSFIAQYFKGS